jgi:ribosomal protein S18 acetylase RimI-like enzyme
MTAPLPDTGKLVIRPVQYRDLEAIAHLAAEDSELDRQSCAMTWGSQLQQVRRWYGLLKCLSVFPNPLQYYFCVYVAEQKQQTRGAIQVSPFNSTRSTWRVEQVFVDEQITQPDISNSSRGVGSQLLRHCFESIWEARTWLLEVNIHQKSHLALYRQNGFQPLAEMTYWAISPEILTELSHHEPDLPNLLPVSNADAHLLYQLDTVSMPPLLRQVFDRHIQDFKISFLGKILTKLKQGLGQVEIAKAYVFEPQRKAAIGYFKLELCRDGSHPHQAELTVHPAYTWLYPQLLAQMAKIVQTVPPQAMELVSADYQPEREEYLEKLGAQRVEHTLLMSRSVWHKLRETRALEALQLSDVFQGLKPSRTPIPSRISWMQSYQDISESKSGSTSVNKDEGRNLDTPEAPGNGHHA